MGRILFWLLFALAAYMGYRWWRIRQHAEAVRDSSGRVKVESMVRCEVCGLNLPQSDAVAAGGHWYCGEEHRRAGSKQGED